MEKILAYLGAFGLYQAYLYLLCVPPGLMGGAQTLMWTWTGFAPQTRCCVPELEDCTNGTAQFATIAQLGDLDIFESAQEQCRVCDYSTSLAVGKPCNKSAAHDCVAGTVYNYTSALIPDSLFLQFDLGCDNVWRSELIWSMNTVGMLLGSLFSGILADFYGRRPVFLCGALFTTLTSIGLTFADNFYAYLILQVCIGMFQYTCYLSAYVIFMEMVDGMPRTLFGVWYQALFVLGMLYEALWAWLYPHWQFIQGMAVLPCICYVYYFWGFPESVRWLVANKRTDEAKKNLEMAQRMNRRTIPDDVMQEEMHLMGSISMDNVSAWQLFANWNLTKNTLLMWFSWFSASFCYYGLAQNTSDLPGSEYTSFVLSAVAQLPGYAYAVPLMEYWGRKPATIFSFAVAGIACILSGLLDGVVNGNVVLALGLIGRCCISAVFAILYNYAAELYPTVLRQTGTGLASVWARVGSILAPQVHLLGDYLDPAAPIVIYGAFALLAGCLDLWLPETLGTELPETVEDAKRFGLKKSKPKPKRTTTVSPEKPTA